jgi:hypothetical protein
MQKVFVVLPSKCHDMLTQLERARLEKRDDASMDGKEKRYNDMIVRNKLKQWLEDSADVKFAIDKLPKKQISKLATDDQIFNLLAIAPHFLDALEFTQVQGNSIDDAVAIKRTKSIDDNWVQWARKAEDKDFVRNFKLFIILNYYRSYLEKSPALDEYYLKHMDKWKNWISKDILTVGNDQWLKSIQSKK